MNPAENRPFSKSDGNKNIMQTTSHFDRVKESMFGAEDQLFVELNGLFFEQLEIRKPDAFLEAVKGTASETIGDIIAKSDRIIAKNKPVALLVYGDTNSCLSAYAAKRSKIPIFQVKFSEKSKIARTVL